MAIDLSKLDLSHVSNFTLVDVEPGATNIQEQHIHNYAGREPAVEPKQEKKEDTVVPDELNTPEARLLWDKVIAKGWVDEDLQPQISDKKAAILASVIADQLGLSPRWSAFENLWKINDLANKLSQSQSCIYYPKFLLEVENALKMN